MPSKISKFMAKYYNCAKTIHRYTVYLIPLCECIYILFEKVIQIFKNVLAISFNMCYAVDTNFNSMPHGMQNKERGSL